MDVAFENNTVMTNYSFQSDMEVLIQLGRVPSLNTAILSLILTVFVREKGFWGIKIRQAMSNFQFSIILWISGKKIKIRFTNNRVDFKPFSGFFEVERLKFS